MTLSSPAPAAAGLAEGDAASGFVSAAGVAVAVAPGLGAPSWQPARAAITPRIETVQTARAARLPAVACDDILISLASVGAAGKATASEDRIMQRSARGFH